ncbi:MAG: alpha/beta hydrolase-fold protein [Bacteroidota bacterium]
MKNLSLILFAICILFSSSVTAQDLMLYQQPKEYEMPPKLIPTVRKYWVSLPKDYDKSTVRYPIVFVFDGDEAYMLNLTLNTVDQLTQFSAMPQCIVVGLIQRNRGLDFAPLYVMKDHPHVDKINADKFLKFLKTELLPELEKNYRTQNFKVGIGHSLGGLFMAHSFTQEPDFFNGVIAASPALELPRDSTIFANLKNVLSSKLNRQTYFCWASGTGDINEYSFKKGSAALGKLLQETPNQLFAYKYIDLPGKNHSLTPLFSVPEALQFVFKDWNPHLWASAIAVSNSSPETAMATREKNLKEIYAAEPESDAAKAFIFFKTGFVASREQKYSRAVSFFNASIKLNPQAGVYRELANAYENLKDYNAAISSLKTGIALLKKDEEMSKWWLEGYETDLKRVQALAISK